MPSLREAIAVVLEYVREWDFEDNGIESNTCWSCGWNSRKDREPYVPGKMSGGLSHKPGCKLRAAMDVVENYDEYWREKLRYMRKAWEMFATTREAYLYQASIYAREAGASDEDIRKLHQAMLSVPGTYGVAVDTEAAAKTLDEAFAMRVMDYVDKILPKDE